MKVLFLLLIVAVTGCGKSEIDPVFNNFSPVGYWIASSGQVLDIQNINDIGENEKFSEYYENGGRFIRKTSFGYPTHYRIIKITSDELQLSSNSGTVIYYRAR